MDIAKCKALKEKLSGQPEPQIVSVAEFFDGNDDLGSIGCNLDPHPGISAFQNVLTGLLSRSDIQAIHLQISELDPGEDSWPFSNTVLVTGSIPADELLKAVSSLQPDEVADAAEFGDSHSIGQRHGTPQLAIWWD